MPPPINPLRLNKLQLKALTLLQELALSPNTSTPDPENGSVLITMIPQPHGNHVHIGQALASRADATGLWHEGVWRALERKGLAFADYPIALRLTAEGLAYETGLRRRILIRADHAAPGEG